MVKVLRSPGQVGNPPNVATDARLGYSVKAYQAAEVVWPLRGAREPPRALGGNLRPGPPGKQERRYRSRLRPPLPCGCAMPLCGW